MSERPNNDLQSTPEAPASVDVAARQLASARRRRFIKLGGVAVPTALTLASRPVMAWQCNTASTWGSAQGMSNSAYTRSQDATRLFATQTYTLNNWISNTSRGDLVAMPWQAPPLSRTAKELTEKTHYKNYTVGALLAGTGAVSINGCSSEDTVWSILNGTPQKPYRRSDFPKGSSVCTDYTKLMLVAWLNHKVLSTTLNKCLMPGSSNVLVEFSNLSYKGQAGKLWTREEVVKYLQANYIACADGSCGPKI